LDDELLQSIRTMADDADWEVRKDAAGAIKRLNDKHFNTYLPVWREWINDPNPNIRRAVEVGLLRIPKVHYCEAIELLVPLLFDEDPYVRKNCGPFADATCSRLAQAEQLGITSTNAAVLRAIDFLAGRQFPDGRWEEEEQVADLAPVWAKPGSARSP
jgi:hypothetical protein